MRINQKYSVERLDRYNIVIIEHKTKGAESKSEGEEYEVYLGYYHNYESALTRLVDMSVDASTIENLISSLESTKEDIIIAIKETGCR